MLSVAGMTYVRANITTLYLLSVFVFYVNKETVLYVNLTVIYACRVRKIFKIVFSAIVQP